MMNLQNSRLVNAALIVAASVITPTAVFAQDAAAATDNSSNFIGLLVVWLLAVGGVLSVFTMIAMDRSAQASRSTRR